MPIATKSKEYKNTFARLGFTCWTFIYVTAKTGLITNATNKEEARTIINVMGKNFINSPIIPGHKASGMNAATVVAVDDIIGQATSPTPSITAL